MKTLLLLSCFYRNQFFSITVTLQREHFEILINSLHRELWRKIIFVKYLQYLPWITCIDIDARGSYNWAQKEEENSTIKFLFL